MKGVLITFDISVDLPFRVQILQPLQYFPQYSSNVSLFKRPWTELGRGREMTEVRQKESEKGGSLGEGGTGGVLPLKYKKCHFARFVQNFVSCEKK